MTTATQHPSGAAPYGGRQDEPTQILYGTPSGHPAPQPQHRRSASTILAALPLLAAAVVGLLGTIGLAYYTANGQAYDENALATLSAAGTAANSVLTGQLEQVSLALAIATLVVLMIVGFARGRVRVGFGAAVLVAGANVTTQAIKHLVARPDLGYGATESLPSGHTTLVFSLALAAVLVAPRRLRWLVAMGAAAVGGLTGIATVIAGWHRPSDAVAALLVTAAWGALVSAVITGRPRDGVRGFSGAFPAVFGAGLAAVGLIIYGFGWAPGDDDTRIIPFTVITVLAVAGLLTGAYSRLVARTSN